MTMIQKQPRRSLLLMFLLLASVSCIAAALPSVSSWNLHARVFGEESEADVSPLKTTPSSPLENNPALAVRGGGDDVWGTPLTKKNIVAFWVVYHLSVGAMLPAVEKLPVQFKHNPVPEIKPGSLTEFGFENMASTCLGIAVMLFFSVFRPMTSVPTVIAYSSLPCFFVFWKAYLKGTCLKLGMPKGFGLFNVALFLGFYYILYNGKDIMDATMAAKIFCFGVTTMGVIGSISPLTMAKLLFGKSVDIGTGSHKNAVYFMFRAFLIWGFGAYSLLLRKDAVATAGQMALVYGLVCLDASHGKKDALECGVTQSYAASFAVLGLVVALAILTN